tara:strand:- start:14464 stop:14850 length:387 start_codon:yes stop_codon:yes gene_type:complete
MNEKNKLTKEPTDQLDITNKFEEQREHFIKRREQIKEELKITQQKKREEYNLQYPLGKKQGKKGTSYLWIFSAFLGPFGILMILFKDIDLEENKSFGYSEGYKNGVMKRRWLYYLISLPIALGILQII